MAVAIGERRRKVIIESLNESLDSPGGLIRSYSTYVTRWMSVEPLTQRGNERFLSDQYFAEQLFKFSVGYDSALKDLSFGPEHRLALSNLDSPETFRHFDIVEVRNLEERNRYIEILAMETK